MKNSNCFNMTIFIVMVCAVASLGANHIKPFKQEFHVNII